MSYRGILYITLLSDTCFSSPSTQDTTIDTDISVDRNGLPILHGKTIHGILRDTWLALQQVIDPECIGYTLFGKTKNNEGDSLLRIGNAQLPLALREQLIHAQKRKLKPISKSMIRTAFTTERTMTAEDRKSGTPLRESMRRIRTLAAGITLQAEVTVRQPLTDHQQQLFIQLLSLTRHAGLHRNRGCGHIKFKMNFEAFQQDQDIYWQPNATAVVEETLFLPLRLKLRAPCILSAPASDPNTSKSLNYIPGASLRGAIASALIRHGATDDDLIKILVSGDVRFLNATPATRESRALPASILWRRNKNAALDDHEAAPGSDIYYLFVDENADDYFGGPEGNQRQPLNNQFFSHTGSNFIPAVVSTSSRVHQQRDRKTGHASANSSTVFVYEAIDPDQTFSGCIAVRNCDQHIMELLTRAVNEPLWLGRSRRIGYGGDPEIVQPEDWNVATETGIPSMLMFEAGEKFEVRFTSDTLIRNSCTGEYDPSAIRSAIEKRFDGVAKVLEVTIQTDLSSGYSRIWRSELPTLPTLRAGSTTLLQAERNISADEVRQLQALPLGDRTSEGMGCFIIAMNELYLNIQNDTVVVDKPGSTNDLVLQDAQRRLYLRIAKTVTVASARTHAENASRIPTTSCMGRVRTALTSDNWQAIFKVWFGTSDRRLKDSAMYQLKKCRVDNMSLATILQRAGDNELVFHLSDGGEKQQCTLLDDAISADIWREVERGVQRFYLQSLLSFMSRIKQNSGDSQ